MRSKFRPGTRGRRRGTILPVAAISMVALCGFVALAVDVGMIAVAKTEVQNAADAAALAGARSIDGSASPDLTIATTNAKKVAKENGVLGSSVVDGDVSVQHGTYRYDTTTEQFRPEYTVADPDTYNLTRATITRGPDTSFAKAFGFAKFNVSATAIAAHRPRDVSVVLDFSGSMNDESDLWSNVSTEHLGSQNYLSNNADPVFPRFGHYSAVSTAALQSPGTDPRSGKSNVSQSTLGIPALASDFYSHSRGGTAASGFAAAPTGYATGPGGDVPLKTSNNTSSTYASTLSGVTGSTSRNKYFELDGYASNFTSYLGDLDDETDYSAVPFAQETQGPGYWGKTFFLWPPDPRVPATAAEVPQFLLDIGGSSWASNNRVKGIYQVVSGVSGSRTWPWPNEATLSAYLLTVPRPSSSGSGNIRTTDDVFHQVLRLHNRATMPVADWRQRFFLKPGGSHPNFGGPVVDNRSLWQTDGDWRDPVDTAGNAYVINYRAILAWIKGSPTVFPAQLRAGRILFYTQVPDDVPASAYNHQNANSQITNQDQRFWKEYIDYVLGVWRNPDGDTPTYGGYLQFGQLPMTSFGPDYTWGTVKISAKPTDGRYMDYQDNPKRPRHRFWFGPMTMIQFMSDTGLMPGTAHDISTYPAKLGISGALQDIKNNHPNDLVSMILYNRPQFDDEPAGNGTFNSAQFSLSRKYSEMIDALWFPPNSGSADVRPWDANGLQTPRASNDYTTNTATVFGFMLAYNQFSGSSALQTSTLGGKGRKGAQRLVILETDGMANVGVNPTGGFANLGAGKSYYKVRPTDTVNSASYSESALLQVVQAICNKEDGSPFTGEDYSPYTPNPGYPGFSKPSKPVKIHTIAFGALFEPTSTGSTQTSVVNLLQQISSIGGTNFPSSSGDAENGYKWCIGTIDERKTKLRQAFSKVMDDGISVSLIQ